MREITFLIPAFNEEKSIGILIQSLKEYYPDSNIVVINNNSTDATPYIAKKMEVICVNENKQGKGHAVRKGFQNVDSEFTIMLDGDNTYNPKDAIKLIKPLKNGYDVVLGSRLTGNIEKGSMNTFNYIGNHILSMTASILYSQISDVCTGYWAFKKNVIDYLLKEKINSSGFEVEAEMFSKISKSDFKLKEIPIFYGKRNDETKLNSMIDGIKIFRTLFYYKIA